MQVWRTRLSVSCADQAPSVKLQAHPSVISAPETPTRVKELAHAPHAQRPSTPVHTHTQRYTLTELFTYFKWCILFFLIHLYFLTVCHFSCFSSEEGWAECKEKPPCSEKDYFQIHTACDANGKVGPSWQNTEMREVFYQGADRFLVSWSFL